MQFMLVYYRCRFQAAGADAAMWASSKASGCCAGDSFVDSIKGVAADLKDPSTFIRQRH